MRYNEIFDFYELHVGDLIKLTYKPKFEFSTSKIRTSPVKEPKYAVAVGKEKGFGAFLELTDGFENGYKKNSIIVRLHHLQKLEIIASFSQKSANAA